MDEVFDAACIPVLITYDSNALKVHTKVTPQYSQALVEEVMAVRDSLEEKLSGLSLPVKVHLFLIPLNAKKALIECLDGSLKGLQ